MALADCPELQDFLYDPEKEQIDPPMILTLVDQPRVLLDMDKLIKQAHHPPPTLSYNPTSEKLQASA